MTAPRKQLASFSLVEVIVAIGVVGVGVVVVMGAVSVLSGGGAYTADSVAASALAQSLLAEIDTRPYEAFTAVPTGRVIDGLVAYYPFEDASGTSVSDASRILSLAPLEMNNPALVAWIPGSNGASIAAGGLLATAGSVSKLSSACAASSQITIELWLAPAGLTCDESPIICAGTDSGHANFIIAQKAANILFYLRTSTVNLSNPAASTTTTPLRSQIMHVVGTFDGMTTKLYVNGAAAIQVSKSGNLSPWQSYPAQMGQLNGFAASWAGKVFLAAVYSKALTIDEIATNFRVGPSPSHLYNRTGYDEIDDYNGYADSPPCAEDGSLIAGAAPFVRVVDVQNVLPGNLDSVQSWNSTDAKRIRVQVFRNYRLLATCVRARFRGVSCEDIPPRGY